MGITNTTKSDSSSAITPKVKVQVNNSTPQLLKTTVLGDIGRTVVNSLTDGHFGNGNAAQQSGESNEAYYNRLIQAGGSALETFNNSVTKPSDSTSMADSFKSGVTSQAVTNGVVKYGLFAVCGVGGFFLIKKLFFNKGGKRPKYK